MRFSFAFVLSLPAVAVAAPAAQVPRAASTSRTSAPAGCLSVGGSGKYKTVQSAVNALSTSSSSAQCIFIAKGTYKEQVSLPKLKSALTIYGETQDTTDYQKNTVIITQSKGSDATSNNDDATATLRAVTSNLKVYNIDIVNTRGSGAVGLAVSASGDKQGYYGCSFKGFQDTVLAEVGKQVYAKSYIEGSTDFIWGQEAVAWFDGCYLGVLAGHGWITASGRDSASNPSYYVINKSTVAHANGANVTAGSYYLGRPWRNFARVVFQYTSLSNVINSEGWSVWNNGDTRTDQVSFGEYKNTGDGAKGTRKFGKTLSAAVGINTVLGSDYKSWVDTSYLS